MKKLLGIVDGNVEKKTLNENIDECGMGGMGSSMSSTPPVTMSVNLNAQGVDNIKELLNLMRSAESGMDHNHMPAPMGMPMPAVGLDMPIKVTKISGNDDDMGDKPGMKPAGSDGDRGMDQIRDLVRKAGIEKEYSNSPEEAYAGVDSVTTDAGGGMNGPKDPADIRVKDPSGYEQAEEEYANEPDEQYSDHNTMIKDLSGGINREKQQYAKAQDGDNAMAVREASIRAQLDSLYKEIKEGRTDEVGLNIFQPRVQGVWQDVPAKYKDSENVDALYAKYDAMIKKTQDEIKQLKASSTADMPGTQRLIASLEKSIKGLEAERSHNHYGAATSDTTNALRKQAIANNELTPGQWLQKATQYFKGKVTGKEQPGVEYDRVDYSKQTEKGWHTPTPYKPGK